MARPILASGKPYPRKRPINWEVVSRVLRYRKDERDALADGFVKVNAFAALAWESPYHGRVMATRINRDGTALYVKVQHAA